MMQSDKQIMLVAQRDAANDDPSQDDIYEIGTIATVMQLLKLPDKTVKVLVEGVSRARIRRFVDNPEFMQAEVEIIPAPQAETPEAEALARSVTSLFDQYVKLSKKLPQDVLVSIEQIEGASRLADVIASHVAVKIPEKQALLDQLLFRIHAVQSAKNNKYILLNCPNEAIEKITSVIPGMKSPTIMPLGRQGWSSLHSVVNENDFWEKIGLLKSFGAEGILVIPIEKMIA
ncbi:MAG: ATP phosphoribosyltransferase, partial [Cyclobacteriaceae bacterium]